MNVKLTASHEQRQHERPAVRIAPHVWAIVVAAVSSWLIAELGWIPAPAGSDRIAVFSTLAQVAGTMLGFMLAALAVVASINHTHLVKMMRRTGHYRELLATLFLGAFIFLLCAVLSLLIVLGAPMREWAIAVLMGLHVSALFTLCLVGWQFWLVLSNLRADVDE